MLGICQLINVISFSVLFELLHIITRGTDRVSCMERSFYCFRINNPFLMRNGCLGDISFSFFFLLLFFFSPLNFQVRGCVNPEGGWMVGKEGEEETIYFWIRQIGVWDWGRNFTHNRYIESVVLSHLISLHHIRQQFMNGREIL